MSHELDYGGRRGNTASGPLEDINHTAHRECSQLQTYAPPFGAILQPFEIGFRKAQFHSPVQETLGFRLGKAQVAGANLGQLIVGAQSGERELGVLLRNPQCRLLTLVGPGGMGKTRLAIQATSLIQSDFSNDVYLIPLASVSSTGLSFRRLLTRSVLRLPSAARPLPMTNCSAISPKRLCCSYSVISSKCSPSRVLNYWQSC